MSNFDFLKDFDTTLWKLGNRIEKQVNISPSGVKADATTFLEYILKQYLASVNIPYNSRKPFKDQMNSVSRAGGIQEGFKNKINNAYDRRNEIHDDFENIEKNEFATALALHKMLFYIAKKYYRDSEQYDEYAGVPPYKAPKIDLTDDEIELLEIPNFDEIVEFKYDYCVVCGESNHSNYSIFCEKCNREINDANNFISIRNNFGKNSQFKKEDLIEYGLHEAYAVSLITSLNKNDLIRANGFSYTFNNSNLDSYLDKIDKFIKVGEMITQFREDKITPAEIKQTKEYKQGSFKQYPFYQFYKVINEEIINKFEKDLLTTENIWESIEYTTISAKELNRWYNIQLNQYKKNNINESFLIFNNLLIDEFLMLKRQGINDKDILVKLDISDEMYEFFPKFRNSFSSEVEEIKKDIILKALSENKSRNEVIELAGIMQKEYDAIMGRYKEAEPEEYEKIINERKERLLINLTDNDLMISCELAKITLDEFYEWYDRAKIDDEFYIKSTKILMEKFLSERRTGKTKVEAANAMGLRVSIIDYWINRKEKLFDKFQDNNRKVTVDLILNGFKNNKSRKEIADDVEVSIDTINRYLLLGRRGSCLYRELFIYYESEVIPINLTRFLKEIKNKSLKKTLNTVDLTENELKYYYENDGEFHDKYLTFKKDKYTSEVLDSVNHETSLKRSNLSEDEYIQLKDEIDEIILKERMKTVKKEIRSDKTTEVAAKHVGVTFDDIYDWYYKGKSDEGFKEFSEFFFTHYIEPNVLLVNKLLQEGMSIEKTLSKFADNFTRKDFEIWQKEGLINKENVVIDLTEDDEDDENMSLFDQFQYEEDSGDNKLTIKRKNSDLYLTINKDDDEEEISMKDLFFKQKKATKSATILKKDDEDIKKQLKKEMGIKDDLNE